MFDIYAYTRYVFSKVNDFNKSANELYSKTNPELLEELKNNRELFNEDGTPVKEITKEKIEELYKSIGLKINPPKFPQELIDTLIITKEELNQFIHDDNEST